MKKFFCLLLVALLTFGCFAEEDLTAFIAKYEQSVAFNAAKTLARVGTDDLGIWSTDRVVKKSSEAWDRITHFDAGWFSSVSDRTYADYRSENWVKTSDTTFECDVYMNNTIRFSLGVKPVTFPCAYHLCFEMTDKYHDTWLMTSFTNLPVQEEIDKAARFSEENPGITIEEITGPSYRGYMMILDDPSRLFVGTIDTFTHKGEGMRIDKLVAKYGALGAINGGGFEDSGIGGMPIGYLVSEGVVKSANTYGNNASNIVMGFTEDDKLVVGRFHDAELPELHIRDALSFNMALIIDGKKTDTGKRQTYSARTAIGQDADGRVLMLVVQGRQPDSLGASFMDLQDIMLSYGAVNAGNLDGGNSTAMYLGGEVVYSGYPLDTSRRMPATFLIKPLEK